MQPLLQTINLTQHFPIFSGLLKRQVGAVYALNEVSLEVFPGETLGIVGESGCGKSTFARTIVRLNEPTRGQIIFAGEDITRIDAKGLKEKRKQMQMIFQDPFSSLNPRMAVFDILATPLRLSQKMNPQQIRDRVTELMEMVGLPADNINRFPHEFSGGQRQRIGIARALALNPRLVIADEPVSALDVSIQSQILNLLNNLKKQLNLTYVFIAHDLAVVKFIADRIAVMYLGHVVELATGESLFAEAAHPYTRALMASIPDADPNHRGQLKVLEGDVPSPRKPPSGCPFHTRCTFVSEQCKQTMPPLKAHPSNPMAKVACFHADKVLAQGGKP